MNDEPADPSNLNPNQEEFARLYYAGPDPLRGNATRCYLQAYYGGHEDYSDGDRTYNVAATSGHRLLQNPKVRARIAELRDEAAESARLRARSWWELYPDAQRTLWAAITGRWADLGPPSQVWDDEARRSAVKAAQEVVERCEGTSRQVHEHRVQGGIMVQVAGPDHRGIEAEREEEPAALRSGPRYIEAESSPTTPDALDGT